MSRSATWAIVPVKRFSDAKLRLSSVLSAGQREALARAMFEDLLDALSKTPEIDALCVISEEPSLYGRPHAHHLLRDPQDGSLNDVVQSAIGFAIRHGATACCVLHADIPLASRRSMSALLQRHRARAGQCVTLVPDRKRLGTNVMVCTPADVVPCRYGGGSLAAHQSEADARGVPVEVVDDGALSLDVDVAEDLRTLLASCRASAPTGSRTRSCLAALGITHVESNARHTVGERAEAVREMTQPR